ncbi:MAG: lytic transglycosylase domain-containing protein [Christensenellales bacterium]|jgi:soluble lytic murein transglycosylase
MRKKVSIVFLSLTAFLLAGVFFVLVYTNLRFPMMYKTQILKESYNNNLQPQIIASLINVESSFQKDAVSKRGAIGLMQVMPSTAQWVAGKIGLPYSEEKLFDVSFNIAVGSYYLKYLINKFGNLSLAICAYNAGETVVNSWLKIKELSSDGKTLQSIPYEETKNHLEKFNFNLKTYEKKYKNFALK